MIGELKVAVEMGKSTCNFNNRRAPRSSSGGSSRDRKQPAFFLRNTRRTRIAKFGHGSLRHEVNGSDMESGMGVIIPEDVNRVRVDRIFYF